jgi:hypothetical protein
MLARHSTMRGFSGKKKKKKPSLAAAKLARRLPRDVFDNIISSFNIGHV